MKKIILVLLSVLFSTNVFSQCAKDCYENINCVIFIDARIPQSNVIRGYFEYTDTLNQTQKIDFYYQTGEIVCEKKEEYSKFGSNPPLNNKVIMNLEYSDFTEGNNNITNRQYKIQLDYDLMFSTIVLYIANVDKKKGTYVYDIDMNHVVGLSYKHQKALRKSRQLKEAYWVHKAEYKQTHNIFQRTGKSISNWWHFCFNDKPNTDLKKYNRNDWLEDSVGCLKKRSLELSEKLIKEYNLEKCTLAEFQKVFGKPNKIEVDSTKNRIELIYYFDSLCKEGRIDLEMDYCWIEYVFIKNKLIDIIVACI
ncbi:MAG: hypothetical protein H6Q16_1175 [Bacteroidetes bacterium]|nr:hypothetical protein [Bacteroidota bacterium]